ncbi:MAG: cold shock domain-containing protein [Candidatus Sericytochromatia bacterium]|nr:cold shock domain-containing protein [Candidatus Tanganyikabacteria bacterium]
MATMLDAKDPARSLTDEARRLQDQGRLAEAARLYLEAYRASPSSFRASRHLHCARKVSAASARSALEFAREAAEAWPEDIWVQREAVWVHYDAYLKGFDAAGGKAQPEECRQAIKTARWMLEATREELPVRLAAFGGAKAAKALGAWDEVLDLLDRMSAEGLSGEPNNANGKRLPSDRERWYTMRARALFELRRYDDALAVASEGAAACGGGEGLPRLQALSYMALGDLEPARSLLEQIDRRCAPQWYVKADLARIRMRQGDVKGALALACEAALLPGDAKGRIGMFEEMAEMLSTLGSQDGAACHLGLALAIAESEGWERRRERCARKLDDLFLVHGETLAESALSIDTAAQPLGAALNRCGGIWRDQLSTLRPRRAGRIKAWNAEREFGFITATDGTDLYFQGRNFRAMGRSPEVGMAVEFEVRSSYDHKKQRDSQVAVDIRPAAPSPRKPVEPDDLPY